MIDDLGTVRRVDVTDAGRELLIECRYDDLRAGESIALNGACLTVREIGRQSFTVAAVGTTLDRTTIGSWQVGQQVNLERALRIGDRLGGHFVQGHVDGVAVVEEVREAGDARLIDLALPVGLAELMVPHGSVAVDGVSLTVNELPSPDRLQIALIEYTLRHTVLSALVAGARVHVEADMLGKHVQRLLKDSIWVSAR